MLELHSCELFAGGCVVSSQSTLQGKYMLQAWHVNSGSWDGATLRGLQVALLQSAPDNLADPSHHARESVLYVPKAATLRQRVALRAWVESMHPELKGHAYETRVLAMEFENAGEGVIFKAGDSVKIKTAPIQACQTWSCGDALWYTPRADAGAFTVAVNAGSEVTEPYLELKWNDSGKRSVFVGRFGDETKQFFVRSDDPSCGLMKLF